MLPNIFKTFGLMTITAILVLFFHHLGLNELLNVLITSIALGASLRYFIGKRSYLLTTLAGFGAVLFYYSAFDLLQMMLASMLLGYSAIDMLQRYTKSRQPQRRLPLSPDREFLNY